MSQRFETLKDVRREYRRFKTVSTQLTLHLNPTPEPDTTPVEHFLASVNDLLKHTLNDLGDADTVGIIVIHNEIIQNERPIGIIFRRRDQISGDVISSVFEKAAQSNDRFNVLDKLTLVVHAIRMPEGFGGVRTKGRPLSVMTHLKRSIIEVKAETNCLAHALI